MTKILCPTCNRPITIGAASCACAEGHKFKIINNNIIDFLPDIAEKSLKEEERHWDNYALTGTTRIANSYIKSKIFHDYDSLFYRFITDVWPDCSQRSVSIAEIGCGPGSAIRFLTGIGFASIDYIGIDVSLKAMLKAGEIYNALKPNWSVKYIRSSANTRSFEDNSLDMVFSASALHHLQVNDVIEWVSKSLKPGGLFIMHEPSKMNPFARLGRKFMKDFHTTGEKPLLPQRIKKISNEHNLELIYEKGLHFLSGPMMYCVQILRLPSSLAGLSYSISKIIDRLIASPSWNYSFIQVYRRV